MGYYDANRILNMSFSGSWGEPLVTYAREALHYRYRFLPYLYTLFYQVGIYLGGICARDFGLMRRTMPRRVKQPGLGLFIHRAESDRPFR